MHWGGLRLLMWQNKSAVAKYCLQPFISKYFLVIIVRLVGFEEKERVGCGCCLPADSNLTVMELYAFTLPPYWLSHRLTESLNKHKHTLQHSSAMWSPAKRFQNTPVRSDKSESLRRATCQRSLLVLWGRSRVKPISIPNCSEVELDMKLKK